MVSDAPGALRAEIRDCAAIARVVDRLDAQPITGSHLPRGRSLACVQCRKQLHDLPVQLDADRGRIFVAGGRGDLIIVVVAEPAANVGLIRVELLKAVESLE